MIVEIKNNKVKINKGKENSVKDELAERMIRKPSSWGEIEKGDFSPEEKKYVSSLPVISMKLKTPYDSFSSQTPQWFVLSVDGKKYLVNTEGFDYARYALAL